MKGNALIEKKIYSAIQRGIMNALNEDKEADGQKKMREAIQHYYKQNPSTCKIIYNEMRSLVSNIRGPLYMNSNGVEKGTYKFANGVVRMYHDDFTIVQDKVKLYNDVLGLVTTKYSQDFDADLNGLSAMDFIGMFSNEVVSYRNEIRHQIKNREFTGTPNEDYAIVPINSFDEAEEYSPYTSWCVTHDKNMYDHYTNHGTGMFYFCLKNGFENIKRPKEMSSFFDDYGSSMIAISIDGMGDLNTCTTRYNHDFNGNDYMMDTKQIEEFFGKRFYDTFIPQNDGKILDESEIDSIIDENDDYEELVYALKDNILGKDDEGEDALIIAGTGRVRSIQDPTWGDKYMLNGFCIQQCKGNNKIYFNVYDLDGMLADTPLNTVYGISKIKYDKENPIFIAEKDDYSLFYERDDYSGEAYCVDPIDYTDVEFDKEHRRYTLSDNGYCILNTKKVGKIIIHAVTGSLEAGLLTPNEMVSEVKVWDKDGYELFGMITPSKKIHLYFNDYMSDLPNYIGCVDYSKDITFREVMEGYYLLGDTLITSADILGKMSHYAGDHLYTYEQESGDALITFSIFDYYGQIKVSAEVNDEVVDENYVPSKYMKSLDDIIMDIYNRYVK